MASKKLQSRCLNLIKNSKCYELKPLFQFLFCALAVLIRGDTSFTQPTQLSIFLSESKAASKLFYQWLRKIWVINASNNFHILDKGSETMTPRRFAFFGHSQGKANIQNKSIIYIILIIMENNAKDTRLKASSTFGQSSTLLFRLLQISIGIRVSNPQRQRQRRMCSMPCLFTLCYNMLRVWVTQDWMKLVLIWVQCITSHSQKPALFQAHIFVCKILVQIMYFWRCLHNYILNRQNFVL